MVVRKRIIIYVGYSEVEFFNESFIRFGCIMNFHDFISTSQTVDVLSHLNSIQKCKLCMK